MLEYYQKFICACGAVLHLPRCWAVFTCGHCQKRWIMEPR